MSAWTSILNGRFVRLSVAIVALAMLGACDGGSTPPADGGPGDGGPSPDGGPPAEMSIADIAGGNPDFSILVAAAGRVSVSGTPLLTLLDNPGSYTVFAPTNAAFEASGLSLEAVEAMPVEQLTGVLLYHALAARVPSSEVDAGVASSVAGFSLIIGTEGGVTLNGGNAVTGGANVVDTDIEASNGIIHVIDRVLLPPTVADLARYAGLTTLAGAVESAGLDDDLAGAGPFTVFAPTNEAFEALPSVPTGDALATVLLYHVVGAAVPSTGVPASASSLAQSEYEQNLTLLFNTSSGVRINDRASVVIADVRATNGIVHVIDEVLLPMNAVDAATAAGLTGLLTAVGAAAPLPDGTSVAAALSAQAPYTIFAPTNAAFEPVLGMTPPLPATTVRDVLLFHVLDPATFTTPVLSTALPAGTTELATLNGATATLDTTGATPTIEGADIVATDIVVTNGVIHLIDAVILPPAP